MKTKMVFEEKGMGYNQDDFVFANRNRSYGAYELRKKYNKRLFISFLIGFFFIGSGIGIPAMLAYYANNRLHKLPPRTVEHILIDPYEDNKIVPPPPPEIEIDMAAAKVGPPVVVDGDVDDTKLLMGQEEMQQYQPEDIPPITPLLAITDGRNDIFDDPDKNALITVQEHAKFKGGDIKQFISWLLNNISFPAEASEVGIQGRVVLQFTINSKGYVGDVKLMRGVHPSINNECIRVLMSSPKWEPARQNGQVVKQQFVLPLVFKIN